MKNCGKCTKIVYPTEEVKCLDKVWHKGCFRCDECGLQLNMKNYKGYNKKPYCNTHYPTTKHTQVADTPESRRIAENTKLQSQVKYHEKFENEKGLKLSVVDDPETRRAMKNMQTISNAAYHKDMEKKQYMEGVRPAQEPQVDLGRIQGFQGGSHGEPQEPVAPINPAHMQKPYQPYRRQPGSITDYDPLEKQDPGLGAPSPYTNRNQSNTVFTSGSGGGGGAARGGPPMGGQSMGGQPMGGGGAQQFGMPPPQKAAPPQQQYQPSLPPQSEPPPAQPPQQAKFVPYEPEAPAAPAPTSSVPKYVAVYDYTAADDDEVSFQEGDCIIDVESIDEGWMTGRVERTGQAGMLPANYVEMSA